MQGKEIARLRAQRGWTQRALAKRAGVPQSTVARIETEAIDPRVETLEKILRALDYQLSFAPIYGQGVDRSLIRRMLKLTPRERLDYAVAAAQAGAELRRGLRQKME